MKNILVTGASKRLGSFIVRHYAALGYNVAVHFYKSAPEAQSMINELNEHYPNQKFLAVNADLCQTRQIDELVQEVSEILGSINIIVNNASVFKHDTLFFLEFYYL